MKITVGGTTHVMGGRAKGYLHRISTWNALDPARAQKEITGGADIVSRQKLLEQMVARSNISGNLIEVMREVHDAMCQFYVRRISEFVGRNLTIADDIERQNQYNEAAQAMNFHISQAPRIGANYRDAMFLLKNMSFTGWSPDNFTGFCPHAPVERMRQLLTFPIELFGVNDVPSVMWPTPPDPVSGDITDPVQDAESLREALDAQEKYYVEVVQCFSELESKLKK